MAHTDNPAITNIDHRNLAAGNNRWLDGVLEDGETVLKDQPLGIISATGEYSLLQSAGTAGEQMIRGFAAEDVDASGGALPIRVLYKGDVDDSQIDFDGADTLATVPAVPAGNPDSYLTMLRGIGMDAITLKDLFIQDNQ